MPQTPAILYLPVETAARELDAKLLLAAFALRAGMRVVLGQRSQLNLNIHRFAPGIYLAHNVDRRRHHILSIVARLGHAIAGWDEEGLVWLSPEVYLKRRIGRKTMDLLQCFFAWGEQQAEVLRAAGVKTPILAIGNPRADLLRPPLRALHEEAARRLREQIGPFFLINSNFGWLNYALMQPAADDEQHLQQIARKSGHPLGYIRYRWQVFQSFLEAIPRIAAAFPAHTIVVRPHPSESPQAWQRPLAHVPNVQVIYDDNLPAWLLAAEAIVHNSCTTAVEAALLGQVPISYEACRNAEYEMPQPAAVSLKATSVQELIELLHTPSRQAPQTALRQLVAGLDAPTTSAERIAGHLCGLKPPAPNRWRRLMGHLQARLRRLERQLAYAISPQRVAYQDKKFSITSPTSIHARLHELATAAGLALQADVQPMGDKIFLLDNLTEALTEAQGAERTANLACRGAAH